MRFVHAPSIPNGAKRRSCARPAGVVSARLSLKHAIPQGTGREMRRCRRWERLVGGGSTVVSGAMGARFDCDGRGQDELGLRFFMLWFCWFLIWRRVVF